MLVLPQKTSKGGEKLWVPCQHCMADFWRSACGTTRDRPTQSECALRIRSRPRLGMTPLSTHNLPGSTVVCSCRSLSKKCIAQRRLLLVSWMIISRLSQKKNIALHLKLTRCLRFLGDPTWGHPTCPAIPTIRFQRLSPS